MLVEALHRRGVAAEPVVWSRPRTRWSAFHAVVIRSCWDYHLRLGEFRRWIGRLGRVGVSVWNDPRVLAWNADKRYLRDMERLGIPMVPTFWLPRRARPSGGVELWRTMAARGWTDAIVKPAVSASAYETWRVVGTPNPSDELRLATLRARGAVLLQPFVAEIVQRGEYSFVFLGGRFSHAVLKRPRRGDFRVQNEHGGTAMLAVPDTRLVRQARRVVRAVATPLVYARVDGIARDGRFLLMELELVEPALFLSLEPEAPDRLARAVITAVRRDRR